MLTSKNRLEAFSDGMFAIALTILILELKVPHLEDASLNSFLMAMQEMLPKFLSLIFSFFIMAIFWVNHHHIVHQLTKVDSKLLWYNNIFLFFTCLFPFLTAFVGDYPLNPYVVALYPINMALAGQAINSLWKYGFVDSKLAANTLTPAQIRQQMGQNRLTLWINLGSAALAFVYVPLTLAIMMIMPIFFVVPELYSKHLVSAGDVDE